MQMLIEQTRKSRGCWVRACKKHIRRNAKI